MKKRNLKEYINRKFGRLTIISEGKTVKYIKNNVLYVNCICECGTKKEIELNSIIRGKSKSCGCYSKEINRKIHTKHGHSMISSFKKNPDYCIWLKMKSRCLNPKDKSYSHYGGRGIKVCDRWLESFSNFIEDMGWRISNKYSIERIDVNGDYCPENCRWILLSDQSKNTRRNIMIKHQDKTLCLKEWCDILHLNYNQMRRKIRDQKMTFVEAMNDILINSKVEISYPGIKQ